MREPVHPNEDLGPLIALARGGDDAAFTQLVERVYPSIYRWALAGVRSPDDADDVTQTVLVQLYRHLGDYRGTARLTSWLFTVTRNAVTDHGRRVMSRRRQHEHLAREADVPRTPSPVLEMERQEMADMLQAALTTLPTGQREAFDLVELQGKTAADAAALLDLEPATVRAQLLRARRALRLRILERGGDPGGITP